MNKEDPHETAIRASEAAPLLLVDDEIRNLEALEIMLASSGCRFVRARSADEALLALLQQEFAAIVLDIRMPGMSGLELAALIKQRRRTQHVPILFLTAHMVDQNDVLRGYSTGAVDYLTKPINPDILRSKIAVFVDLFRKTRALAHTNEALQREVIERQRMEEALRRINQELEQRVKDRTAALQDANRRKDEFLAALAHELRNPLAPVRTAVEVMRLKGSETPDLQWAHDVISRQVQQMSRLLDDLLDVSRITRGKLALRTEIVDMARVISNAVETCRPHIEQRRHALTVRVPEEPIQLDADVTRLSQALANLLHNAAKYTEPGGRIELSAEAIGADVVVRVTDTGIGIDADMLPHVFELFVQVDRNDERAQGGLGIGLTLVRRLAELHGGSVEAHSAGIGRGSEFTLRLPARTAGSVVVLEPARLDAAQATSSKTLRVLVVDDNRDAAEMLGVLISTWGHETRVAYDGMEALTAGEEFRPQVVLLDIGLPRLDGYEAARRLREQPWAKLAILAAVTGWGQKKDRRRSRAAGFDHHLVKPVDPDELRALLAETAATPTRAMSATQE